MHDERRPHGSRPSAPLTNPRSDRVRAVAALGRRSARTRAGAFLAEGPQAVREAVAYRPDVVRDVFVDPVGAQRHPQIVAAAQERGLRVQDVSESVLAAMCDTGAPQGLLAVCGRVDVSLESVMAASPRLLMVLSHVRDPGNAGTVIRGADAAGADAVLISDASVDVYNPKVVRSTVGSLFHVPVVVGEPVGRILSVLGRAGVRRYAADGAGPTSLYAADLGVAHAWVMGNEAWGLPDEVAAACDDVVRVPIYGRAESLNLAMAATLCVYASAAAAPGGAVTSADGGVKV